MKAVNAYLFPYQKAWLADKSRYKIWEKSRRIGATYVQALEDVLDCLSKNGLAVWFSSADDSAAKEYILYCAHWAKVVNAVASAVSTEIMDEDGLQTYSLAFKNGSRINAMSSNPKAFRSKGGKVILDEFAWHRDATELWKAARPVITWGFDVRVLSTHNGRQSQFYQFLTSDNQVWSKHKTSLFDAVNQGLADRLTGRKLTAADRQEWLEQEHRACNSEDAWQQEYCCNALDETTAFLPYEMILAAERPEEEIIRPLSALTGDIYIGFDVARHQDLSAIVIAEQTGPVLITRHLICLRDVPFSSQRKMLFEILALPCVRRCCIDASGLGMNLAEDAQTRFGQYKVEAVTFTAPVKGELATDLRIAIGEHRLLIPASRELRDDLHSIKRIVTAAGNVRYDAQRSETDGHADRFWALALCCHAAKDSTTGIPTITTGHRRQAQDILRGF